MSNLRTEKRSASSEKPNAERLSPYSSADGPLRSERLRLPDERIKEQLLHRDPEVREAALEYFAESFSLDPAIMLRVIQAIDLYGLDAFKFPSFFQRLVQSDATVAWLIREIERIGSSTDEQEYRYAFGLAATLRHADARVLECHEATIKQMQELDQSTKKDIANRVRFNSYSPAALGQELAECRGEMDLREPFSDKDFERISAIMAAMSRDPNQVAEVAQAILNDGWPGDGRYWEIFWVQMVGEMRLESAVPQLLVRLATYGLVCDEAVKALAKVGTDAVAQGIAERYASEDWIFRRIAAAALGNIHTDSSVSTALDLLDQEKDENLRGQLLRSILMNFSPAGIELARQHILKARKSPKVLDIRKTLLMASRVAEESFPELEVWLEDSKHDAEFRDRWYKEKLWALDSNADNVGVGDYEVEDAEYMEENDSLIDGLPHTIICASELVGRHAPCRCGSGEQYLVCCHRKGIFFQDTDEDHATALSGLRGSRGTARLPVGTVAFFGPDNKTTSKIVAGVVSRKMGKAIAQRWVGTDIKDDPEIRQQMKVFFGQHNVRWLVLADGNIGCAHEEGIDFPAGQDCPFCPFWAGRQGRNAYV